MIAGRATVVAAVVLALAAGFVGGELRGAGAPAAPDDDVADLARRIDALGSARSSDAARTAAPSSSRRPAAFDERQADEDRRMQALETGIADLKKAAALAAESTPAAREAAADLRRLQKLGSPELLAEIDARVGRATIPRQQNPLAKTDAEAALRACDAFLPRELTNTDRATALLEKGRAHGVLEDRANEEAAFREALKVAGPASPVGHLAAAQLGWTASRYKEPRAAAEWFLSIAHQPDAAPRESSMYRLFAANGLAGVGETARARELYRAVIDEFAASDDTYAARYADECKKALAKLDQGGSAR